MKPNTLAGHTLASLALAAAMAGMPALGQQRAINERRNAPGERLRPTPKAKVRRVTDDDLEALARAEAKRERKGRHLAYCADRGAFRQTAAA